MTRKMDPNELTSSLAEGFLDWVCLPYGGIWLCHVVYAYILVGPMQYLFARRVGSGETWYAYSYTITSI